jgi:glycosyltransferase involved in cell wall biosynthesis
VTGPRIVALVAAHNEEPLVGRTVKALRGIEAVDDVVVVADGSTDRTADEASGAGARVLVRAARRGKGGALEACLSRIDPAEVYVLVDGDVADTATEAERLLEPVLGGDLDLAIGRLPPQPGGGFGLVKRLAAGLIDRAVRFRPEEPLSGQRAIRREVLEACRPLARGFGVEVAMTIDAARLGFRIGEIPVEMSHRATGRTVAGFVHRARQGLDILRASLPRFLGLR